MYGYRFVVTWRYEKYITSPKCQPLGKDFVVKHFFGKQSNAGTAYVLNPSFLQLPFTVQTAWSLKTTVQSL